MGDYPWYAVVSRKEGLEQGDFILACPILEPIHDGISIGAVHFRRRECFALLISRMMDLDLTRYCCC